MSVSKDDSEATERIPSVGNRATAATIVIILMFVAAVPLSIYFV